MLSTRTLQGRGPCGQIRRKPPHWAGIVAVYFLFQPSEGYDQPRGEDIVPGLLTEMSRTEGLMLILLLPPKSLCPNLSTGTCLGHTLISSEQP